MNVATVFKQSTTTSARMSTNIHCTELSSLSSIRFDQQLNRQKISSGQKHQNKQYQPNPSQQPSLAKRAITTAAAAATTTTINKQVKTTTVLMESNSVLNVVQKSDNDHLRRRRHSLSVRDERMLRILSAPPDEPLYINGTPNHKSAATLNADNNCSSDNLLMQYEAATSSITGRDDYENENLPPTNDNKNAAANIEDANLDTMSLTPQKGFSLGAWNKLQRDLNSPSASCRMRAIRAINSPANCNYYRNFDVTNEEQNSIDEVECSIEQPRSISEVMKDVVVYVEYRSGTENRTTGIKAAIANLGAKVNDRLLRNTTHVVFKDGLQSTYNKAKSWNIPIVSILWIEACKRHLILMNPSEYPIPNIEKYENPDPFEKTKRHKYIQPDTLMKNLHRPIPKSKILEELKKTHDSSSILSSTVNKTVVNGSPNVSQRKTTACVPIKATSSRKSIAPKNLDAKPKHTIRSMFAKQLEKSRIENSQSINGTIDRITSLDLSDPASADEQSPQKQQNDKETEADEEVTSTEQTGDITLVTGSLHKRLTRRNSMTIPTPTKTAPKPTTTVSTPNSAMKRRRTMFTPSFKGSIQEEQDSSIDGNSTATTDKTILAAGDKTVNKSVAMDVCSTSKNHDTAAVKSNSKVRQLLNNELMRTPRESGKSGLESQFALPSSRLARRTTYTSQVMDETNVQSTTITPVTKRRMTMNTNAIKTPRSKLANSPELNESKSCDAILTPTNQIPESGNAFSSTPLIQSLSKAHRDHIRSSTSKTLLDEYNNTFCSKKTPMSDNRKTIANITMDIIKQRIENINRNASLNGSTNDLFEDSLHSDLKATPNLLNNVGKVTTTTPVLGSTAIQLKPLKRKLFAPPSLFPENSPMSTTPTLQKTDKKTVQQKRKKNDLPVASDKLTKSDEKKKAAAEKPRTAPRKTTHSRRSTMFFETPVYKSNSGPKSSQLPSSVSSTTSTANRMGAAPGLVFTSMHKPQIDFITEAVKKLGKFKLEEKVGPNTTHLVALDGRRTVNMLRALIRGVWILEYDWILKSVEDNHWHPEIDYEMNRFSKAVEINRIERQAFGPKYRMDIFRNFDTFYISSNCECKSLKQLITLCYGKVVPNKSQARYIISENHRSDLDSKDSIQLHPNWILDSISAGKMEKPSKYILKPNIVN